MISEASLELRSLDWSMGLYPQGKLGSKRLNLLSSQNNSLLVGTDDVLQNVTFSADDPVAEVIDVPKRPDDKFDRVFADPLGRHVIVTTICGDNFYFCMPSLKVLPLSRFQGAIECVAYGSRPFHQDEAVKNTFLLGTNQGVIYQVNIVSGVNITSKVVHQFETPCRISSLYFEYLDRYQAHSDHELFVSFVTSDPLLITFCLGSVSPFDIFFPGLSVPSKSSLLISRNDFSGYAWCADEVYWIRHEQATGNAIESSKSFAVLTNFGICVGTVNLPDRSRGQDKKNSHEGIVFESKLIPYCFPTRDKVFENRPVALAVTAGGHFLLLWLNCLQSICRISGEVVAVVSFGGEKVETNTQGVSSRLSTCFFDLNKDASPVTIHRDVASKNIWMLTSSAVYQVFYTEEEKSAWFANALGAVKQGEYKLFSHALSACSSQMQRTIVLCIRAEIELLQKRESGGEYLAFSGLFFEDATLKLLGMRSVSDITSHMRALEDSVQPAVFDGIIELKFGPLLVYLYEIAGILPNTATSQKALVASWICDIILHKLSRDELTAVNTVGSHTHKEFIDFVNKNRLFLDEDTTLSQFKQHDILRRPQIQSNICQLLFAYAKLIGNHKHVLAYHMARKEYIEVLRLLEELPVEEVEYHIYKNAPILIENEAEKTIDMVVGKMAALNASGLIPAFMRYVSLFDSEDSPRLNIDSLGNRINFAIKFMRQYVSFFMESASTSDTSSEVEPAMLHAFAFLLCKYDETDEAELVRLIQMFSSSSCLPKGFDGEFILRLCKRFHRKRAVVFCYLFLGLEKRALEEALHVNIDLAMIVANRSQSEVMRAELWLLIAKHLIHIDKGSKRALAMIEESQGFLGIEDILPYLPEFTEIDLFKDEICQTLEVYSASIEDINIEIEGLSNSADIVIKEIELMNRRGVCSSSHQRCEFCSEAFVNNSPNSAVYVFPCAHVMHTDCLIRHIRSRRLLAPSSLAAVKGLEEQIRALRAQSEEWPLLSESNKRLVAQLDCLQGELDGYVAAECPLCGDALIQEIARPILDMDGVGDDDWLLMESWLI